MVVFPKDRFEVVVPALPELLPRKVDERLIVKDCMVGIGLKGGFRIGWIFAVTADFSYAMTIVMLSNSDCAELLSRATLPRRT